MTYNQKWSKKRRVKLLSDRAHPLYKKIHQGILSLNILNHLPSFNTYKYDSHTYFAVLEYASVYQQSVKQTCLMNRLQGRNYPSPEQVMKCCRTISPEVMTNFVNIALQSQFKALPKVIQHQLKKSRTLIIDFHQDCYYGDSSNPHVKKGKAKKSTTLFYEYLTADLYCKNGCFTIALIHRIPGERIFSLLKKLLEYVEQIIEINTILFDGEFATLDFLHFLLQKGVHFLGRKSKTKLVKAHLDTYYRKSNWKGDRKWRPIELRSKYSKCKAVSVDICPQKVHGKMKFLIKTPNWTLSPKHAEKLYGKRFNIETGYRDKHKFQIFTCTKILSTRLLICVMAILLWNCWQGFLIWIRALKSYSADLPRDFQVLITISWFKYYLKTIFQFYERYKNQKEVI